MRILFAIMITLTLSSQAEAQLRRLTATEIVNALQGNTVLFNVNGVTQRQFFEVGGVTIFEDGRQEIYDEGRWRVTLDHRLCTNWQRQGWACYELALEGSRLVWTGPITQYTDIAGYAESKLVAGNKTNAYRERPRPVPGGRVLPAIARMLMGEGIPGVLY